MANLLRLCVHDGMFFHSKSRNNLLFSFVNTACLLVCRMEILDKMSLTNNLFSLFKARGSMSDFCCYMVFVGLHLTKGQSQLYEAAAALRKNLREESCVITSGKIFSPDKRYIQFYKEEVEEEGRVFTIFWQERPMRGDFC